MTEVPFQRPEDRRREIRREFVTTCSIMVTEPSWVMTRVPIKGTTENITLHGLRINDVEVSEAYYENVQRAIADGNEVIVQIELRDVPNFPALKGSIVWHHRHDLDNSTMGDEESARIVVCSIGIFFSVLRERDQQALSTLVDRLAQH